MSVAAQLPAEPLLHLVRLRGVTLDPATQRALMRAQARGRITLKTADVLAVRLLGLTPGEIWGEDYWNAPISRHVLGRDAG